MLYNLKVEVSFGGRFREFDECLVVFELFAQALYLVHYILIAILLY